jgi:hypothetical protein
LRTRSQALEYTYACELSYSTRDTCVLDPACGYCEPLSVLLPPGIPNLEEEEGDWVANRAADGGGVGVRSPAGGTQSPVISRTTHGEIATSATSGASDVISTSGDAIWRYEITCAVPVEVPEMAAARRISSRSPWAPSVVSGLDQPTLRTALETADGEGGGGEGGGGGGGGYRPEDDEDEDADEVAALQAALVASAASADSISPSSAVDAHSSDVNAQRCGMCN